MQAVPSNPNGDGAETAKKKGIPTWVGCLIGCSVATLILMVLLAVLGTLAAIAVPNFVKARTRAQGRSCYAIQRVIAMSLDMRETDTREALPELTPKVLELLLAENYLKKIPDDPGAGPGSSGNYVLVTVKGQEKPRVFCLRHGFRDRPASCSEDSSPADQLRAAGVEDEALLNRASSKPPGMD